MTHSFNDVVKHVEAICKAVGIDYSNAKALTINANCDVIARVLLDDRSEIDVELLSDSSIRNSPFIDDETPSYTPEQIKERFGVDVLLGSK